MTKAAKNGKNQPKLMAMSLNTGNTNDVANDGRPRLATAKQAASAIAASIVSRMAPANPLWLCRVTFR